MVAWVIAAALPYIIGCRRGRQGEMGIGQLVTVDLKLVEERVRGILPDFPQVAGAYLFGSALSPCRPDSDIDLALVSHPGISARGDPLGRERLEARVVTAMGRLDGHPFDVVVLDPDDAIFSFKAITRQSAPVA